MEARAPCFLLMESAQDGVLTTKETLPHCIGYIPPDLSGNIIKAPEEYIACICEAIWLNSERQGFWVNKFKSSYTIVDQDTGKSEVMSGMPFYNVLLSFVPILTASGEDVSGDDFAPGQKRLNFDQVYVNDPSNSGTFKPADSIIEILNDQTHPKAVALAENLGMPTGTSFMDIITTSSLGSYRGIKWELRNKGVNWALYPEGSDEEGNKLKDQAWYKDYIVEWISVFCFSISTCAKNLANGQRSRVIGGLPKNYATVEGDYPKIGDTCTCYQAFLATDSDADDLVALIKAAKPENYNGGKFILSRGPGQPQGDCFVCDALLNSNAISGPAARQPSINPDTFRQLGFLPMEHIIVRLCFWNSTGATIEFPWPHHSVVNHGSQGYPIIGRCIDPVYRDVNGVVEMETAPRRTNIPKYKKISDHLTAGLIPTVKRMPGGERQ
jgi:hypothetical protein